MKKTPKYYYADFRLPIITDAYSNGMHSYSFTAKTPILRNRKAYHRPDSKKAVRKALAEN